MNEPSSTQALLQAESWTEAQMETVQKVCEAAAPGSGIFVIVDDSRQPEEWYLRITLPSVHLGPTARIVPIRLHRLGTPGSDDRLDTDLSHLVPPNPKPNYPYDNNRRSSCQSDDQPAR